MRPGCTDLRQHFVNDHTWALVATQRAAPDAMANKHDLAALFVKLAGKHGSPEQQALKVPDLERETR